MTIARTVGRNTVSTAFARFAVLGVWFLVTPRVLAALGAEQFGFWSILLAFGGSLAALDLGLGVAVTRSVARLHREGGRAPMAALLRRTTVLQAAVTLAIAAAILLAASTVLDLFHVPAAWSADARLALALALVAFFLTSLGNLFLAGLQGLQRMDQVVRVALPAAVALGIGVVWGTGQARPLVVLTAIQVAYAACTALAYGALLAHLVRHEVTGPVDRAAPVAAIGLRELLALGGWVQVNSMFGLLQAHVDKFILGALLSLAPVASYELGARITIAAMIPPVIFIGSLLPAFARTDGDGRSGVSAALYARALDPHFAMTLGLAGALVGLAPWILGAWLRQPPEGAGLCLVALAVAQAGHVFTGVTSTVVRARGDLWLEFVYAVLGTGLHVALAILGLSSRGLPGLLVGTAASSVIAALWYVRRVESTLEVAAADRALRRAVPFVAAAGLAGVAAFIAAGAVHPARAGAGAWGGLAAGSTAYVLVFAGALRAGFPATWHSLVARARHLGAGD